MYTSIKIKVVDLQNVNVGSIREVHVLLYVLDLPAAGLRVLVNGRNPNPLDNCVVPLQGLADDSNTELPTYDNYIIESPT